MMAWFKGVAVGASRLLAGLGVLAMAISPAFAADGAVERVAYPAGDEQLDLSGELAFPDGRDGRVPVVVVVHGSGGLGPRERAWGAFLRQQGLATFTIDYFGPRGITRTSPVQPTPVGDVIQAVAHLAKHPRVDPSRIGIIGFSRGAVMSIAASNDGGRSTGGIRAVAHIALYPSCRRTVIDPDPVLPPVLILVGTQDSYTTPDECLRLANAGRARGRAVALDIYEGATHAWDSGFDGTFHHQAADRMVTIHPSPEFTGQARDRVLLFLRRAGME